MDYRLAVIAEPWATCNGTVAYGLPIVVIGQTGRIRCIQAGHDCLWIYIQHYNAEYCTIGSHEQHLRLVNRMLMLFLLVHPVNGDHFRVSFL